MDLLRIRRCAPRRCDGRFGDVCTAWPPRDEDSITTVVKFLSSDGAWQKKKVTLLTFTVVENIRLNTRHVVELRDLEEKEVEEEQDDNKEEEEEHKEHKEAEDKAEEENEEKET